MDTCPVCGASGPLLYHDGRCTVCALRREHEQHRQMKERSGPQYELSVTRARAGTAAWNAAGRPAAVRAEWVPSTFPAQLPPGTRYEDVEFVKRFYLARSMKRGGRMTRPREWIEATPEQVEAWEAYVRQRSGFPARLRSSIGP